MCAMFGATLVDHPQTFKTKFLVHCTHLEEAEELCEIRRFDGRFKSSFKLPQHEMHPFLSEGEYTWLVAMPETTLESPAFLAARDLIPQAGGESRYGPVAVKMELDDLLAAYGRSYGHYEVVMYPCEVCANCDIVSEGVLRSTLRQFFFPLCISKMSRFFSLSLLVSCLHAVGRKESTGGSPFVHREMP